MFCRVEPVNRLVGPVDQIERVGTLFELLIRDGGEVTFLEEVRRDDVVVVVDRRVEELDDPDKLPAPMPLILELLVLLPLVVPKMREEVVD